MSSCLAVRTGNKQNNIVHLALRCQYGGSGSKVEHYHNKPLMGAKYLYRRNSKQPGIGRIPEDTGTRRIHRQFSKNRRPRVNANSKPSRHSAETHMAGKLSGLL